MKSVIKRLELLLEASLRTGNRISYFIALYLHVSRSMQRKIDAGDVFDDNERMTHFANIFVSRFLDAWTAWCTDGEDPTLPWRHTFEQLDNAQVMVATHLCLGMNAHITFDLGIAAEQVMRERGRPLCELQRDFDIMNELLASLSTDVQLALRELSPTFRRLDISLPLLGFVFRVFLNSLRVRAWHLAHILNTAKEPQRKHIIATRSIRTYALACFMLRPPGAAALMRTIAREENELPVSHHTSVLKRILSPKPHITTVSPVIDTCKYSHTALRIPKPWPWSSDSSRRLGKANTKIDFCPLCGRNLSLKKGDIF